MDDAGAGPTMDAADTQSILGHIKPAPEIRCSTCPEDGTALHGRRFLRYNVSHDAAIEPLQLKSGDARSIRIVDISRNGLGFVCGEPLPIGSIWRVRFMHGGTDYPMISQTVVVVFSQPRPDATHRVGAQLVFEPWLLQQLGVPPSAMRHQDKAGCTFPLCAAYVAPDSPLVAPPDDEPRASESQQPAG